MVFADNPLAPPVMAALLLALTTSTSWGFAAESLEAASTISLVQSMVRMAEPLAAGHIEILGVETRDNRTSIPLMGALGRNVTNLGAGKEWHGWENRMEMYAEAVAEYAKKDAKSMLILTDVSDMVYGGCSNAEMLEYYEDVVKHSSGAAVVYGGSVYCYPCNRDLQKNYKKLVPRMTAVLDGAGLPRTSYCSDKEKLAQWESPGYSFLNGGFAMGPAGKLSEVLRGALDLPAGNESFNDQMAVATYMMQNPEKVTVDYTGRLVLTENRKLLLCQHREAWLRIEGDHLVNNLTKRTACFVHGAGSGIQRLRTIGVVDFMTPAP